MHKVSLDELYGMVNSKYSLVTIVSKRARQIIEGDNPRVYTKTIKPVSIAIEEFSEDKIKPIYPDEE
ncbi:DNA-directed RNA polymerase subunit omega [Sedimentibacter sp. zth1]|uniref:DNA-directed RNA polymerase subunit omega n=1 Tax=Sedimentibacter sp. zth1 TaxID=2816908 RepID=UPI001A921672|nr:DNA-directed RNA polymerase subunit omega [Sedimentibacter sp. zth1]QSX06865.1 DNA-directed RNA polymerase subunit omega [Sedimentibacter sp. zth1]